jgi:hypothetical protein
MEVGPKEQKTRGFLKMREKNENCAKKMKNARKLQNMCRMAENLKVFGHPAHIL